MGRQHDTQWCLAGVRQSADENRSVVLDQVVALLEEHGIKKADFVKAYNSFGVRLKMKQAIQLNAGYDVRSVPNFVIDGKYRTSATLAGSEERAMKVIEYLIQKAARERK